MKKLPLVAGVVAVLCGCGVQKNDQPATTRTFGDKLRTDSNDASAGYPANRSPLSATPPWMAGRYYSRSMVALNNGDPYIAWMTGVSAPSGAGPIGKGAGPILDGSVIWYYWDQPTSISTEPTAPAITDVAKVPSTLSQFVDASIQTASFLFTGGNPIPATTGTGMMFSPFPRGTVSFVTDAPEFAIKASTIDVYQLVVDGRNVFAGGRGFPSGKSVDVDFTNAGGRKTRNIKLIFRGTFSGVAVDAASKVSAPIEVNTRVCVFGDSFTGGGHGFPMVPEDSWTNRVAQAMGWNDIWNLAVGGTGYINGGPTQPNFISHITDATSNACEMVIFFGGGNDIRYGPDAMQAAALKTFRAARAGLPNAPLVVLGLYPGRSGPSRGVLQLENAIHAAVEQFNDPQTYWVPVSTDPAGPWVSGTGTVTDPKGDGNADECVASDGSHPVESCIDDILAPHIIRAMQTIIQQIH